MTINLLRLNIFDDWNQSADGVQKYLSGFSDLWKPIWEMGKHHVLAEMPAL